jgi:sugar-phosphatase
MEFICTAILFDLDGVLVDSSAVVERHWRRWADHRGVSYEDLMEVAHGRTSAGIIRIMAPYLDAEHEGRIREALEGIDTDGLVVYEAAYKLLRSLPSYGWGVVTSGLSRTASTRLQYGDFPTPPVLVTAEDVHRGKPEPEAYLLGANRLGVRAEECVVVEDAPAGIEAARTAGMRVIAVATTHSPEALTQADVIASDLAHVTIETEGNHFRVIVEALQGTQ